MILHYVLMNVQSRLNIQGYSKKNLIQFYSGKIKTFKRFIAGFKENPKN